MNYLTAQTGKGAQKIFSQKAEGMDVCNYLTAQTGKGAQKIFSQKAEGMDVCNNVY